MKIGIIGQAGHANFGISDQHPLVALAPGVPGEDMQTLTTQFPHAHFFNDPADLLQHVDLVVVNPPFHAIARWTLAALEGGVPVLAEKPLATTEEDLARVEAAWQATQTPLTTMLDIRYRPAFQAAWQAVRAGVIGDVRMVTAQKSYRLGQRPAFYHDRATYGGTIPWIGAHSIDLLRWFAGCEFKSVTALHSTVGNCDQGRSGSQRPLPICHGKWRYWRDQHRFPAPCRRADARR